MDPTYGNTFTRYKGSQCECCQYRKKLGNSSRVVAMDQGLSPSIRLALGNEKGEKTSHESGTSDIANLSSAAAPPPRMLISRCKMRRFLSVVRALGNAYHPQNSKSVVFGTLGQTSSSSPTYTNHRALNSKKKQVGLTWRTVPHRVLLHEISVSLKLDPPSIRRSASKARHTTRPQSNLKRDAIR